MKYPYIVEHAGGAFMNTQDIKWKFYSRHTSFSAAEKAVSKAKSFDPPHAWSDHFRIVAQQDGTAEYTCTSCWEKVTIHTRAGMIMPREVTCHLCQES